MSVLSDDQVRSLLLANKLIEENKINDLIKEAETSKTSLVDILVDKDVITDENLGILISDFLKIPFVALSKITMQQELLRLIPESYAQKQHVIVFGQDEKGLKVAMSYPNNREVQDFIVKKTNLPMTVYFATEKDIEMSMKHYHEELQKSFDELINEKVKEAKSSAVKEVPVSKIVDLIITQASQSKASDIHIEPEDEQTLVRFRVDGMLHDVLRLPFSLHEQVVSRIKVLARLRTDEHLSAQDGKLQLKINNEDMDVRVSVVPVVGGEKIVMRLLVSKSRRFSLLDLGFNEKDLDKVNNGFKKPHGMVLSTGPTGSGKSTTIYAMIKMINSRERNIATIEDPVEYEIAGVNQIQVNAKTNLTFADGLRAILRQDPDVIFVGEIRDEETAGIAINAAMTGHLVFSTLHTNDAATTLPRLMDMNIEPFLVASTVNVIIAQRLVRKICDRCKYSQMLSHEDMTKDLPEWIVKKHFSVKKQTRAYRGKGCPVCHLTGYQGRIGVFEVLEISDAIRELISAKADADVINKKAIEEGMQTMLEDGIEKVRKGFTTLEEVLRVTKE
jgi:type IV pilus assembly protein PilB